MTPVVAPQDEAEIARITERLPQALLLVAEPGLDSVAILDRVLLSEPSQSIMISPEEPKKVIAVEQIRTLIGRVRTHASERRVVRIRPAGTMTEEAQNALLKILEEPAAKLHIILEVSSEDEVLPTILSRCQVVTLSRTTPVQDASLLDSSSLDAQAKQQILFLAAGRPTLIRQLVDDEVLLASYRTVAADAKTVIGGTPYEALTAALSYGASREQARQLLDVMTTMLRFKAQRQGVDRQTVALLEQMETAESALANNGNVKLALLQLVGG